MDYDARIKAVTAIMERLKVYKVEERTAMIDNAAERCATYSGRIFALHEALDAIGYKGPRTRWDGSALVTPTKAEIGAHCLTAINAIDVQV